MKNTFITNFFFLPLSKRTKPSPASPVTAHSRWRSCAAPSGSASARRCVWLSATCLCTETPVPGSETATCQHRHTRRLKPRNLKGRTQWESKRSPRYDQQPVQVLGRYALRVVLPHIYKVIFNWLRLWEAADRSPRFNEHIKEAPFKYI